MDKNRTPDEIDKNGNQFWYDEEGKCHNDNGPAFIMFNGDYKAWYKHGYYHNENDPAQIYSNGSKYWWIDGKEYTEEEFKQYKIKQFIYNE